MADNRADFRGPAMSTPLDERALAAAVATTPFGPVATEAIGTAIRAYLDALPTLEETTALAGQAEQIASLIKERDEARTNLMAAWNAFGGTVAETYEDIDYVIDMADGDLAEQISTLDKQRRAAESRLAELEQEAVKVVEPFAKQADTHGKQVPDSMFIDDYERDKNKPWYSLAGIRVGELRAARTFLSKLKGSAS